MPFDLPPPKLWAPPKPAIIRALSREELVLASFLPGMFPVAAAAAARVLEFVGVATAFGTGTVGVNYPAGTQSGDFLILARCNDDGTPAAITDWTSLVTDTSTDIPVQVIWRIAGAETSVNISSMSGNPQAIILYVFRGTPASLPFEATRTTANGSSGNPNCPSITTVHINAVVIAFGFLDDDNAGSVALSGYSNVTGRTAGGSGGATSTTMAGWIAAPSPGPVNPPAFTSTGDDAWFAVTVAISPAGGDDGV